MIIMGQWTRVENNNEVLLRVTNHTGQAEKNLFDPAGIRTRDLRFTSPMLYQLSYRSSIGLVNRRSRVRIPAGPSRFFSACLVWFVTRSNTSLLTLINWHISHKLYLIGASRVDERLNQALNKGLGSLPWYEKYVRVFYREIFLDKAEDEAELGFWLSQMLAPLPLVFQARMLYILYGPEDQGTVLYYFYHQCCA